MLKALYDYALREKLTLPPGYVNKTIKAYISLYADGSLLGVEMGGPEALPCPDIGSLANGTDKSNVLVEKSSLVLPENPNAKSTFYLHALADAGTADSAAALCAEALQDEDVRQRIRQEFVRLKIKPQDRIGFLVDGEVLHQREGVIAWWQTFRKQFVKAGSGGSARCLITGELCDPVATVPPVTGLHVVGGHARGDALICFDKAAFCSYGLDQAANAPVSEEAMSAVKAALDQLLAGAPILAGMKFVHWYDRPVPVDEDICTSLITGEDNPFGFDETDEPDTPVDDRNALQERQKATRLVRSVDSGEEQPLPASQYYILLLSGVGGRVMIRRYEHGRYEALQASLAQWFDDLRLCSLTGSHDSFVKPKKLTARLIRLMKRQKSSEDVMKRLAKELAGITPAVLTAILTGAQLPIAILTRSLSYIRSQMLDAEENTIQVPDAMSCQWLKVYLCRKERQSGEVVTMAYINPNHPSKAYHIGRMVAVYARIQEAGLGREVNAGIVERYYASASQTPALVLGTLSRLSNHHLAKIENRAAADRLTAALEETAVAVGDEIPVTLTLEEQAYFALGYRQQCAEMNRQKAENIAAARERKALAQQQTPDEQDEEEE
ncbi:MAG: type I-C CRISPR-associated protein Cas8c/Csd1 [Aristaeellaceae bacterium]